MKKVILIALFAMLFVNAWSQQNYAPNPSFELYTTCPGGLNHMVKCISWDNYTDASSDYFHRCASGFVGGYVHIPNSFWGYQQPEHGDAYVGVITYAAQMQGALTEYKEYVAANMTPLPVFGMYEVSMSVSLGDTCGYATEDLGVYFFDFGPSSINTLEVLPVTPQISYSKYGIIRDTQNWVRVVDTFIADSAYDNMVIGGFGKYDPKTRDSFTRSNTTGYAFYYIDSVEIRLIDSLSFKLEDSLFCAGDTLNINYYSFYKNSSNVFTMQLSDASGSFANAVDIGTDTAIRAGTMQVVIPPNTSTGQGYRMRLLASSFADTSLASKPVKIGANVNKPVAANNGPVCSNVTLELYAASTTSGVSYEWTGPNSFSNTTQNPEITSPTPANSGAYIVTARFMGCEASDTTTATVNASVGATNAVAVTNGPICKNEDLQLTGGATGSSLSYSWIGPNSFTSNQQNPTIATADVVASGTYVMYVSNGNCTVRDTVEATVKPIPENFSGGSNAPLCTGTALQFSASSSTSGVSFSWTGPNSFNANTANPVIGGASSVHDGSYFVTADLNGCELYDTVSVTVKPVPVKPVANSNSAICAGDTLYLTSSTSTSGVAYSWTGPSTFTSNHQNPSVVNTTTTMSGDYVVTADLNGCSRTDTVSVTVKPYPSAVTAVSNSPLCVGDNLNLSIGSSTSGSTYSWSGPNSFSSGIQTPAITNTTLANSGWYVATVDLNGCIYKDSTSVDIYSIPSAPNLSYSSPICVGETLELSANNVPGASYAWTGANSFAASVQNPTRSNIQLGDTGTYTATVTVNGCTSAPTNIKVSVNPVPFVVIQVAPGDTVCAGSPAVFTPLPSNHGGTPSYRWYVNGIQQNTGVNFSIASLNDKDVVYCDMTESTKCKVPYIDTSNDIEMDVVSTLTPTVSITANPTPPIKEDEYITFTATANDAGALPEYQWKRNGADISGANASTWSANTLNDNDQISVEVRSSYRCPLPATVISNSITVTILSGIADNNAQEEIRIYPNPAGDYVVFDYSKAQSVTPNRLSITNSLGQKVLTKTLDINSGKFIWQTIDMSPGVYMYHISSDDATISTGRIVITQ